MSYLKTAAVAALVSAAAIGASMTAANAGGKHSHHGFGLGSKIVIGPSDYGCKHWLRRYKKTGNPFFLDRYYACTYYYY